MSEILKAYLAGLIDADGSIHVTIEPALYIKVVAVNESFLLDLCNKVSLGNVYLHMPKSPKHPQGTHQWIIKGKKAGAFLEMIYPYLVLKRKQAKIGIQFASTYGKRISSQIRQFREVCRLSLKALNHYEETSLEDIMSEQRKIELARLHQWQDGNSHPYLIEEIEG